jgi:hypothetical protein
MARAPSSSSLLLVLLVAAATLDGAPGSAAGNLTEELRWAAHAAEGLRERARQDAADGVTLLNAARSFHNAFRHCSGGASGSLSHGSAFLHSAAPLLIS